MTEKEQLPESLRGQLRSFEHKLRWMETVLAISGAGAGLLISWLVLYLSDRFWETPGVLRVLLTGGGVIACALCARFWLRHWFFRRRDVRELAKLIQRGHRQLGDRLLGIVELTEEGQPDNFSPALVRAAIRQVASESEAIDFKAAVKSRRPLRWGLICAGGLLALGGLFLFTPDAGLNALRRWLRPVGGVARYTFVSLEALPDELVVPHGEEFTLVVGVRKDSFKKPGRAWVRCGSQRPISARVVNSQATFTIPGQRRAVALALRVWDATRKIRIKPRHRPALKELAAFVTYPEYLLKSPRKQNVNGGHLAVLAGSRAAFRGKLGRNLAQAGVLVDGRQNGARMELKPGGFLTNAIPLDKVKTLTFTWTDQDKLTPRQPYRLQVETELDGVPVVEFPELSRYLAILIDESLEIELQAEDDHGLKELGVEWYVSDLKRQKLTPSAYTRRICPGDPYKTRLKGTLIFAPALMNIPPQSIVSLTGVTTDYYPTRGAVKSAVHEIYILSRAEHAKLIKEQFEQLQARLEDLTRSEENVQERTTELQKLDPEVLAKKENSARIKDLERDEYANQQELNRLAEKGLELLKEALRNKDLSPELLQQWARMIKGMRGIAAKEMQGSRKSLSQALQNPGQRREQLGKAAKQQAEAIKKLMELLKDLNDSIENMVARNFVNRLRELAGREDKIKGELREMLPKTVGATVESLSVKLQRRLGKVQSWSEGVRQETELIMDDLGHFFNRTRLAKYENVFREMQGLNVLDKLDQQSETIKDNRGISAMQQADYWGKQFSKWAEMLGSGNNERKKAGSGGEMTAEQLQLLLELMRIVQQEENIRSKTRLLERRKEFDEDYQDKSLALANQQAELRMLLNEVIVKVPPGVRRLLDQAGKAMDDAERLLALPQTDGQTVAAETEVIELLSAGCSQCAGAMGAQSAAMAALMRQLMQQMGLGSSAGSAGGGSGAGGGSDTGQGKVAGEGIGGNRDPRATDKAAGLSLEQVPMEFREAMKAYFYEVEKLED